jgi:APA family basic amino acid/polyamine antiporter
VLRAEEPQRPQKTVSAASSGAASKPPIESRVTDLARRLGVFDATMIVMGGIIGAGIFISPYVVARHVHTPALILGVWVAGGAIALAGAFVYAELAALRPEAGGVYAYLRDAFHPIVAFLFGWTLLLVVQAGGMAAVAVTFGLYVRDLTGIALAPTTIAVGALAALTIINCFGVRAGANVQNALMVLKIIAIGALVTIGWLAVGTAPIEQPVRLPTENALAGFGAAMVPVLFAYGGWQTASFVSEEMREPQRDLPRALLWGIIGVIGLYLAANLVYVLVLNPSGLASTTTPASEVMRRAIGESGARFIALGIAISTIGFLSQGMLTAPRVYFAMARDGVFFTRVGWLHPKSRAPVYAIALQGVWAVVIALSGRYEQILNYVVAIDAVFFGLTGAALLVFRRREARDATAVPHFRTPGHPWTTILFVAAFWIVALNTVVRFPTSAGIGVLVLLAGVPVYLGWSRGRVSVAPRS